MTGFICLIQICSDSNVKNINRAVSAWFWAPVPLLDLLSSLPPAHVYCYQLDVFPGENRQLDTVFNLVQKCVYHF